MEKSYLKTQQGEYLQVRFNRNEIKLYALDRQHPDKVYIQRREVNQRQQMSFKFLYKNEYYSPKVDGKSIKLERVSVADGSWTVDGHWFEKVDLGSAEVYSLKTVVETPQYLTKPRVRGTPLSLTPELQQCLRITDEEA